MLIDRVSERGGHQTSYAVGEDDGRWLPVHRLGPPPPARSTAPDWADFADGISCWSRTSCTFTGVVLTGPLGSRQFVQTESNGVWGPAKWIPASSGDAAGDFRTIPFDAAPFSCWARGSCVLGGSEPSGNNGSTSVSAIDQEVDGRWLPTVLGPGGMPGATWSLVVKVACDSSSLCVAVGGESSQSGNDESLFSAPR